MIPYGRQNINREDIKAVIETLKSDWLTQGPKVKEFEQALADYCQAKYAIAVNSGTAALHLAYLASGFTAGDEAITTPNTFAATANMLIVSGIKPVFADIRLDTYNIDEERIEKLITKKTKAIVPVHFAGQPCNLEKIKTIARKHNLIVIEDACHALGAKYKNLKIGACNYSDMAVFSFHPVKSICTGEGGAILTNNERYYKKIISWRSHGIGKDKNGWNVMLDLGYNYRLSDIQASLGLSQLRRLDQFILKRRRIVAWYKEHLAKQPEIILPEEISGNYSSWHIYVVRTVDPKKRDRLAAFLKENGVSVNFHYPAVYSHPFYRRNGYRNLKLENMELYQKGCLTMPCYPGLQKKQISKIAKLINLFFKKRKL